jgi:hypothetical protein
MRWIPSMHALEIGLVVFYYSVFLLATVPPIIFCILLVAYTWRRA